MQRPADLFEHPRDLPLGMFRNHGGHLFPRQQLLGRREGLWALVHVESYTAARDSRTARIDKRCLSRMSGEIPAPAASRERSRSCASSWRSATGSPASSRPLASRHWSVTRPQSGLRPVSPAQRSGNGWYRRAMRSRIEALKAFARRLRGCLPGLLAHCRHRLHTSVLEGIHNKIKVIKRMAYGCRDDRYFFLEIRAAFPGIG